MSLKHYAVADKTDRRGGRKRAPFGRFRLKHRVEVRSVAVVLAGLMLFSIFGANVSSIIGLLDVKADALDNYTYYDADLKLYDYYSNDDGTNNDTRRFDAFNSALYNDSTNYVKDATGKGMYQQSGYYYSNLVNLLPTNAHPTTYYPLYLGWQHDATSQYVNNVYIRTDPNTYNYSLPANAQACDGSSNAAAAQGMVNDTLTMVNGVRTGNITQGAGDNVHNLPYFDESFLTRNNVGQKVSGSNGKFRFRYHSSGSNAGYYVYDSLNDGLVKRIVNGSTQFSVVQTSDSSTSGYQRFKDKLGGWGFFPVESSNSTEYAKNFGFGARFDIDFTMTEDGKNHLNGQDMKFNFSGDDDVWVFIDGYLILDIGGAHGRVEGNINFAKGTTYVSAVKKPAAYDYSRAQGKIGTNLINFGVTEDVSDKLNNLALYNDPTHKHRLTVFYIERGHQESNCMITFNFHQADTLTINNHVNVSNVNAAFRGETLRVAESEAMGFNLANNGRATDDDSPEDGVVSLDEEVKKTNPSSASDKVTVTYYIPNSSMTGWQFWKSKQYNKGTRVLLPTPTLNQYYEFKGWTDKNFDLQTEVYEDPPGTYNLLDYDTDILYGGDKPNSAILVENITLYSYWTAAPVSYTSSDIAKPKDVYGYIFMNTSDNLQNGGGVSNMNDSQTYGSDYIIRNYTNHFNVYDGTKPQQTIKYKFRYPDNSEVEYPPNANWFTDYSGMGQNDGYNWRNARTNSFLVMDTTPGYNYSYLAWLQAGSIWVSNGASGSLNHMNNSVKSYLKELFTLREKLATVRSNLINNSPYTGSAAVEAAQLKSNYDDVLNTFNSGIPMVKSYDPQTTNVQTIINLIKRIDPSYTTSSSTGWYTEGPPELEDDELLTDPDGDGGFDLWNAGNGDQQIDNDSQATDDSQTNNDSQANDDSQTDNTTQNGNPEDQQTTDSPDEPDEPADPDGAEPKSGNSSSIGHWAGNNDGKTYKYVNDTNYRLKWIGYSHSVVRRTHTEQDPGDSQFLLTGNQSAKFTVMFRRDSNLKVAPNGYSYLLSNPGKRYNSQGAVSIPTLSNPDGGDGKALSNRYSTTWQVYDNKVNGSNGSPDMSQTGRTSITTGYSARTTLSETWTPVNNPGVIDGGEGSFLMDYVNETADSKAFVDVYVDYTQTVLTGSVVFTKTASASEKAANPNKQYEFRVTFSNVFGGGSGAVVYGSNVTGGAEYQKITNNGIEFLDTTNGIIKLKADEAFIIEGIPVDTDYVIEELTDSSDNSTVISNVTLGGLNMTATTVSGVIDPDNEYSTDHTIQPVRYYSSNSSADYSAYEGDLTVSCSKQGKLKFIFDVNPNDPIHSFTLNSSTNKYEYTTPNEISPGSSVTIHYVKKLTSSDKTPFSSNYTVEWIKGTGAANVNAVAWDVSQSYCNSNLADFVVTEGEADCITSWDNGTKKTIGVVRGKIIAARRGTMVDGSLPNRAQLPVHNGSGSTGSGTTPADDVFYIMNTYTPYSVLASDYSLVMNNDVPSQYLIICKYIDKLYYSENDDPAGLMSSTLARQQNTGSYTPSFSGPTGTASDPNGYQGATDAEQTFIFKISEYTDPDFEDIEPTVFYETVSFGSSDGTMKYKVMKINPGRYYRVEELSDWSWKYEHTDTQVTNTSANSVFSKVGYLKAFTETITPSSGHTYQNAAMVTFTNYKYARDNDPQRKVEGDTAVEVNRYTKPAS